ncbi:response regulator transcription factor [Fulvivirgaceae bacterium PWU4]|uniref:Response regulator transcription factor n=1 Tax=Chryseosolibacter histidini TaxID=2782349 RepID=A0AAP2GMU1_9BACT|nr:response regulator transcription factor [Chryseosolibacter histidini]MBT1697298.1 response regulator transcription factor [Chryseosolibacter histidini]
MDKIRILIADDHKIIRVGLRGMLALESNMEVVGEAEDGKEVVAVLQATAADVVLMDIDMGKSSGIEATEKVKGLYPQTHVLALTMHEEETHIIKMLEAGARGYLLKNAGREELVRAIETVFNGDTYFSHSVSGALLKALMHQKNKSVTKTSEDIPLSEREIEVLKLIAQEYSNREIADKLFISIRTVDTHRRNILEKLDIKNTAGLVKYAISKGLI